jgi:hypothetical protein
MTSPKSFYDLDYMVELSEKRVEQYTSAYQLILGRLANIILVYSALGIYLIPIVQDLATSSPWPFWCSGLVMFGLIIVSLFFTVRLMWPVYISYLEISKHYFEDLKLQYERRMLNPDLTPDKIEESREKINILLKASYLDELNEAQINNRNVFVKKSGYYFKALVWGLVAVIPYAVCIGYHINTKNDKIPKVEVIMQKKP